MVPDCEWSSIKLAGSEPSFEHASDKWWDIKEITKYLLQWALMLFFYFPLFFSDVMICLLFRVFSISIKKVLSIRIHVLCCSISIVATCNNHHTHPSTKNILRSQKHIAYRSKFELAKPMLQTDRCADQPSYWGSFRPPTSQEAKHLTDKPTTIMNHYS